MRTECYNQKPNSDIYFELTSLARVKFPPHKPYIVAKYESAPLYDAQLRFIHKYIRQVTPSTLFSTLCEVYIRLLHLLN